MKISSKIIALLLSSYMLPVAYAAQNDLHLVQTFADWHIFKTLNSKGNNECYAVSEPKRTRVFSGLRNQPYFAVRYISAGNFTMSVFPGFQVAKGKAAIIDVGSRSYMMEMGDGSFVWPANSIGDVSIMNAFMLNGDYFRVNTINRQGDNAIDYYSLRGLYRALQYMGNECW